MTLRDLRGVTFTLAAVIVPAVMATASRAADRLPWQNAQAANDAYHPPSDSYSSPSAGGYSAPGSGTYSGGAYSPSGSGDAGSYGGSDAYNPSGARPNDAYSPNGQGNAYTPPANGGYSGYDSAGVPPSDPGYGQPYTADPVSPPAVSAEEAGPSTGTFNQNEIIGAGHQFFGSISQSLAKAVEYAFQSQGRPNGYILGEDAGGALVLGLRYGEGTLYTKNAGNHKVFWQGPSLGYDAGAEGSKTMVLVYNLSDPSDIYNRFGGIQGAAYVVGGVSVQFQKYNDVTLGVIRSGVGLRLGANVGYLKYTREPTWNPL